MYKNKKSGLGGLQFFKQKERQSKRCKILNHNSCDELVEDLWKNYS